MTMYLSVSTVWEQGGKWLFRQTRKISRPGTEGRDVVGIRQSGVFADEALHEPAVLKFEIADAERRRDLRE
jgi:hypothetical protein